MSCHLWITAVIHVQPCTERRKGFTAVSSSTPSASLGPTELRRAEGLSRKERRRSKWNERLNLASTRAAGWLLHFLLRVEKLQGKQEHERTPRNHVQGIFMGPMEFS